MFKLKFVQTIDDMICFLKEKGRNHDYYYHYTNWDSLTKIMQNKTFLLTRGNSLSINDQNEAKMKGSLDEWNKIYIGSFAFGSNENMAMWGLYGLPWPNAVRICIPKEKMNWWVNHIYQLKLFENGKTKVYRDDFEVDLNDMIYVSEQKETKEICFSHASSSNKKVDEASPLYNSYTESKMTGYIKNSAWKYENEVRLRIRLSQETGYEKISIDIPNTVINSIRITTGPCFDCNNNALYQNLLFEKRIDQSNFENLVKYRNLCDMCEHSFAQKN